MPLSKNRKIEASNIIIKRDYKDNNFLISNLSFKLEESKTKAFYFKSKLEKKAFISLFTNSNIIYSGLFKINDVLCTPLNVRLIENAAFHKMNLFDDVDPKTRVIEVIEKEVIKYKLKSVTDKINENNQHDKNIKLLKIYKYRKIQLSYFKTINILIKKSINHIEWLINEIQNHNIDNQRFLDIYKDFFYSHINYLKNRVNLVIDWNIKAIDLYYQKFDKDIKNNDKKIDLQKKIKDLLKRIENFESYDKSLIKLKKQIHKHLYTFKNEVPKNNNFKKINFNKLIVSYILMELDYKDEIYKEKIKSIKKNNDNQNEYVSAYLRRTITNKFSDVIKKNSLKIINFNEKIIESFLEDYSKKYSEIIRYFEKDEDDNIKNASFLKMKKIIGDFIDKELAIIINKYATYQDITLSETQPQKLVFKSEIESNIHSIRIEFQNLLDEIEWENESVFFQLNDDIKELINLIDSESTKCTENQNKYNELVSYFNDLKNQIKQQNNYVIEFVNHSENPNDLDKKSLNDEIFEEEISKFETIYKFIFNDTEILKTLFTKPKITISKTLKNREIIFVISRYIILKKCKDIKISIFQLLRRIGKIDDVLKNTFFLILGLFDDKKITIYDNLFSNLSFNNSKIFSNIYKEVVSNSKKSWILIESNILNCLDAIDNISIIDKSKQIEYGETELIFKKPIYDVTREAFGMGTTGERPTPESFAKNIDYDLGYDQYEIRQGHYIYGNINKIYEWTKIIPQESTQTISNKEINDLKNKIDFERISKKTRKQTKTQNVKNKENDERINSEEYLIIDVTSEEQI